MLTGDENIADLKFRVIWQIDPAHPEYFAFNIKNQAETIKAVAESVMRDIVGHTQIQPLLTVARKVIEPEAQQSIQNSARFLSAPASKSCRCSCFRSIPRPPSSPPSAT